MIKKVKDNKKVFYSKIFSYLVYLVTETLRLRSPPVLGQNNSFAEP